MHDNVVHIIRRDALHPTTQKSFRVLLRPSNHCRNIDWRRAHWHLNLQGGMLDGHRYVLTLSGGRGFPTHFEMLSGSLPSDICGRITRQIPNGRGGEPPPPLGAMHACQVHPVMNRTLVPYRQGTVGPSVGNPPASRYAYRFDTLSSWSAAPLRHRRQQQSCLFPRAAELGGLQAFPVYPHQKIPFCRSSPLSAGPPTSLCSEITLSRSGVARVAG